MISVDVPGTEPTPRLAEMVRLLRQLDDDEFRLLPTVLSEHILERERQLARALQQKIGGRCDVIWPGQAELWDMVLIAVEEETGTARVQYSPAGRRLDIPASTVVMRVMPHC